MSGLLAALEQHGRLTRPDLSGLTTAQLAQALGFAQRIAAFTCGRVGADPPWRHELTG
jgi:fructokinase